eukprot:TRINITY_DN2810_c1_g3_i1.p1 TRINITY_DN2810_c1_g3~~TRINITY_DN2810_c1_g3_i1.p1  ORF type:complete len:206 (-),score=35.76 TRINITY_DN2810_c1_g3_i1:103-720(-)
MPYNVILSGYALDSGSKLTPAEGCEVKLLLFPNRRGITVEGCQLPIHYDPSLVNLSFREVYEIYRRDLDASFLCVSFKVEIREVVKIIHENRGNSDYYYCETLNNFEKSMKTREKKLDAVVSVEVSYFLNAGLHLASSNSSLSHSERRESSKQIWDVTVRPGHFLSAVARFRVTVARWLHRGKISEKVIEQSLIDTFTRIDQLSL